MNYKNNCYIQNIIPEKSTYFKEELFDDVLSIPCEKPDLERILDIVISLEIEDYKLINTEVGYSYEGQRLTGKKLIVEIKIKEKLTYVADKLSQTAHGAHYESLKGTFIILPEMIGEKHTCDLIRANRIKITPYVEGLCYRKINKREVHRSFMLLVDANLA